MKLVADKKTKLQMFAVRLEPKLIKSFTKACKRSGVSVQSAVGQLLTQAIDFMK